jgi:hypothetical protein
MPLSYTPRKFITHPTNHYFYMIEGDHRVLGPEAAANKLDEMVSFPHLGVTLSKRLYKRKQGKVIDDEVVDLPPEVFGRPKAPAGTWASCIRIIDPIEVRRSYYPVILTNDSSLGENCCAHTTGLQRSRVFHRCRAVFCAGRGASPRRWYCRRYAHIPAIVLEWVLAGVQVHGERRESGVPAQGTRRCFFCLGSVLMCPLDGDG